ncbi:hypothetical protein GCM10022222_59240 [Amycolatopsis ultiminotia]|uniref:DUF2180 family protein n=1 Tax=Amycolatopsis ultiminotia TaxID=543629 RepID=A0ABP6XIH3_9PSEU
MHCLDCFLVGDDRPAVGVCTSCGAAVCRDCVRIGRHPITHVTGFSSADRSVTETRQLACPSCATALSVRHSREYGFAPPAGSAVEMQ